MVGQSFKYPSAMVTKLLTSVDNRYTDISSDILGATIVIYLLSWPVELQHGESMYLSRLKFVLVDLFLLCLMMFLLVQRMSKTIIFLL